MKRLRKVQQDVENDAYAGFWLRFCASSFDFTVIALVIAVFSGFGEDLRASATGFLPPIEPLFFSPYTGSKLVLAIIFSNSFLFVEIIACTLLYFPVFESSPLQGTPGKLITGIAVLGDDGARIGLFKSTVRNLARFLPLMPVLLVLVGATVPILHMDVTLVAIPATLGAFLLFLLANGMSLFDPQRQAMHDKVAGCLLVKRSGYASGVALAGCFACLLFASLGFVTVSKMNSDDTTFKKVDPLKTFEFKIGNSYSWEVQCRIDGKKVSC